MNFELSGEQRMLADALGRYLRENYPFDTRRSRRSGLALDEELWSDLAERLGVLAATLPEEHGGLGGGAEEAMVICEALGDALVVEPFVESIVLSGGILRHSQGEHAETLLRLLGAGKAIVVFAHDEADSRFGSLPSATRAETEGERWRLNGSKSVVSWAPAASHLIVSAACPDGPGLFLVERGVAGVDSHPFRLIDDRPAADIRFDDVILPADALLVGGNAAATLLDKVQDEAIAAICADAVGVMRRMYADTVAYTLERSQFGQPLASFQVLQHRMVDMYIEIEQAVAATHLATLSLGETAEKRRRAVSAAKATICRTVRFVSQNAVQLHGAMGMTDELPVGHYFRRAAAIELQLGSADDHMRRYAAEIRAAA